MAAAIPFIVPQYFDDSGRPLSGGSIEFFQAGTNIPITTYTDSLGGTPNPNPMILDAGGRAAIFMAPGSYKVVLKNRNGVVIWTQDRIKPADGGGGGIVDEDYVVAGYSLEFNREVNVVGLQNIINDIYRWGYQLPTVNLTSNIGTGPYEKGFAITAINFTTNVVKGSNLLDRVRFKQGASVLDTQTVGGAIPNGGNSTYNWTGSITDTTTFSTEVRDAVTVVGGGGDTIATRVFNYVYAYFRGPGAPGLSNSSIAALGKEVITSTNDKTISYNMTPGNVPYFAYPASYGDLTLINDANGFDVTTSFTKSTKTLTNMYGQSASYTVYEHNNPWGVTETTTFRYRR